jgi:glycerophosphoryl diester phosphodiesterase
MKKYYLIFSILFSFFSFTCKVDRALIEVENLNNNEIGLFGHGGTGISYKYPINSLESIQYCLNIGADGTEMDLQLTRDSVLVAFHPHNLNDATLCEGEINSKLWSEIWGCHYTSPLSSSINIIGINDLFEKLNKNNNSIYTFDCKLLNNSNDHISYKKQFANAIIKTIQNNKLNDANIFIESNDTLFLSMLKLKNKHLKLFYYSTSFEQGLIVAKKMQLFGLTMANENISANEIKKAHLNNLRITLWNIKTKKENLNAISKNPDYIQSDKINHLLKVFGKLEEN